MTVSIAGPQSYIRLFHEHETILASPKGIQIWSRATGPLTPVEGEWIEDDVVAGIYLPIILRAILTGDYSIKREQP